MKRLLRLTLFAATTLAVALSALNFGLAWIMVMAMTQPICKNPTPVTGWPTPEEHWLPTADGIEIRVWYYPSQNGAAVLAFGGMGGALGERLPPAAFLLEAGYGIVQVDTRACARPSAPVTQGHDELYDAEAALDFLLTRPEVDPGKIGAIGFSMGGATALRLAAQRAEVQGVVRDGGFANLGALLTPAENDNLAIRAHKNTMLLLYRLQTGINPWDISPVDDLDVIAPRPVLLIYGEHEAAEGVRQIQHAGENTRLWVVPGGSHGRNHLAAPVQYRQQVLDFFAEALQKVSAHIPRLKRGEIALA